MNNSNLESDRNPDPSSEKLEAVPNLLFDSSWSDKGFSHSKSSGELALHLGGELLLGPLTKFEDVWRTLAQEPYKRIDDAEKLMAKFSGSEDYKKSFGEKLRAVMDDFDAQRIERLIAEKNQIEIPAESSRQADKLMKPGSDTSMIGKTSEITLPDGRSFDLYIPNNVRTVQDAHGQEKIPTILAIQGVATGADIKHQLINSSGLTQVAEREGTVLIFPHATVLATSPLKATGWSVPGRQNILDPNPKVNDVEEIHKMIGYVRDNVLPISDKVGVIGHSDGGRMSQVYAAERPDDVAALVAWNTTWMKNDKPPEIGKPIAIVITADDPILPIKGGRTEAEEKLAPGPSSLDFSRPMMMQEVWSHANQCSDSVVLSADAKMKTQTYTDCKQPVSVYTMHSGGHGLSDWHNIDEKSKFGGLFEDNRDLTLDMTHNLVTKHLLPYIK